MERPDLPALSPGMIRVALLVPLSGQFSDIGKGMLNAAQMAIFDAADESLQLIPYDTGGSPKTAKSAAERAVANEVALIVGPLLSVSTRAVDSVASAANVPVISFSSDRKVAGNGVYVIGFAPETEVERVMSYAADNGAKRFFVLGPRDSYGDTVAAEAKRVAKEKGLDHRR
ncbi:MAG: ABC transporter substrate-binding protein, partial [Rhodospirillales bacterium]|nr:ABC transporter substrate-binding protein [Rhodospirillales bacterium]